MPGRGSWRVSWRIGHSPTTEVRMFFLKRARSEVF
jgi:hypothetical protein